ncbi:hypothetical protein F4859DRAFT_280771 [Xylaria cf. heliscus]|nr:hypothetical protein F4859DRAFT_280771 [Xylaria cf. heliscus]
MPASKRLCQFTSGYVWQQHISRCVPDYVRSIELPDPISCFLLCPTSFHSETDLWHHLGDIHSVPMPNALNKRKSRAGEIDETLGTTKRKTSTEDSICTNFENDLGQDSIRGSPNQAARRYLLLARIAMLETTVPHPRPSLASGEELRALELVRYHPHCLTLNRRFQSCCRAPVSRSPVTVGFPQTPQTPLYRWIPLQLITNQLYWRGKGRARLRQQPRRNQLC